MAGGVEVALTLARLAIGVTLLVAGAAKLNKGQDRFLRAVLGYELVSGSVAAMIARWMPWLETLTGLMLIIGFLVPVATIVAFGLFFVFTLAIVHSLLRGLANDCGCLKGIDPVRWRLVYRNVFLMGLLLPIYSLGGGAATVDAVIRDRMYLPVWVFPNAAIALLLLWAGTVASIPILRWLRSRSG